MKIVVTASEARAIYEMLIRQGNRNLAKKVETSMVKSSVSTYGVRA